MIRTLAVFAVASALLLPGNQQEIARFRSTADAVRVDVLVTNKGRPLAGLQASDFELRDTGVTQAIEAVSIEDVPVTLFLALDTSSSVEGLMLQQLKAAAKAALAALRPDDHAALITFSDRVSRPAAPTLDRASLSAAIEGMRSDGPTALRDAVFAATALRERAPGRVVLLLFTDGIDTISWLPPTPVLEAAVRSDMVIYVVSTSHELYDPNPSRAARLASSAARLFLQEPEPFPHGFVVELTDRTGGSVMFVQQNAQIATAFAGIVAEFKSRYLLTYSPRGVPPGGWHPIEVKLKNRRGDVTARRGYWR